MSATGFDPVFSREKFESVAVFLLSLLYITCCVTVGEIMSGATDFKFSLGNTEKKSVAGTMSEPLPDPLPESPPVITKMPLKAFNTVFFPIFLSTVMLGRPSLESAFPSVFPLIVFAGKPLAAAQSMAAFMSHCFTWTGYSAPPSTIMKSLSLSLSLAKYARTSSISVKISPFSYFIFR